MGNLFGHQETCLVSPKKLWPKIIQPNNLAMITASDFREGASRMGLGFIDDDIVQSAFNTCDDNRKGYLDQNEASCAYGYLHRLYT